METHVYIEALGKNKFALCRHFYSDTMDKTVVWEKFNTKNFRRWCEL